MLSNRLGTVNSLIGGLNLLLKKTGVFEPGMQINRSDTAKEDVWMAKTGEATFALHRVQWPERTGW